MTRESGVADSTAITWTHFADFSKLKRLESEETAIVALNQLLGLKAEAFDEAVCTYLKTYPSGGEWFLLLVATRYSHLNGVPIQSIRGTSIKTSAFRAQTLDINEVLAMLYETGLAALFQRRWVHRVDDYLKGVEIGLDSHARKNRSGSHMEKICEPLIQAMCQQKGWTYEKQATRRLPSGRTKRFDFVIEGGVAPIWMEVNRFQTSGSKLKAISDAYMQLEIELRSVNVHFVWITTGQGWKKEHSLFQLNQERFSYFLDWEQLKSDGLARLF